MILTGPVVADWVNSLPNRCEEGSFENQILAQWILFATKSHLNQLVLPSVHHADIFLCPFCAERVWYGDDHNVANKGLAVSEVSHVDAVAGAAGSFATGVDMNAVQDGWVRSRQNSVDGGLPRSSGTESGDESDGLEGSVDMRAAAALQEAAQVYWRLCFCGKFPMSDVPERKGFLDGIDFSKLQFSRQF